MEIRMSAEVLKRILDQRMDLRADEPWIANAFLGAPSKHAQLGLRATRASSRAWRAAMVILE